LELSIDCSIFVLLSREKMDFFSFCSIFIRFLPLIFVNSPHGLVKKGYKSKIDFIVIF